MQTDDFEGFRRQARADGYDAVLERQWAARTVLDTHAHPFAVRAVVVQGEMWLTCGDQTQHLGPGDTFTLDAEVPHTERYGPEGAIYWVARRGG